VKRLEQGVAAGNRHTQTGNTMPKNLFETLFYEDRNITNPDAPKPLNV